jgi:hypothetical protein
MKAYTRACSVLCVVWCAAGCVVICSFVASLECKHRRYADVACSMNPPPCLPLAGAYGVMGPRAVESSEWGSFLFLHKR